MHEWIGRRGILMFSALALSVIAFAGPPTFAAQPASRNEHRTITVSGEGDVKATPDEAHLSAGVVSQAPTAEAALEVNRRDMNALFATLKQQGIPDKSIQTTNFSVSPQYETGKDNQQKVVGYQVSNTVAVTVDDLSKLGSAIDALVASGANSMGGVNFTIREQKPLLRQAREAAIKDAMDRAQTYARAAGVGLGPIMAINDSGTVMPRPFARVMALDATAAATPIAAGEETVSANVTVTFEIR